MIFSLSLAIILLLALVFYCVFIIDSILTNSKTKYIDVPTSRKARTNIQMILGDLGVKEGVFYDLGSGHGSMALAMKRAFPGMEVHGFDKSGFKIVLSKLRSYLSRNRVVFRRTNIFNVNLADADIIYTYIWHTTMIEMKDKIEKEAKKGVLVISNTFPVLGWEPVVVNETLTIKKDPDFEKIYVYRR